MAAATPLPAAQGAVGPPPSPPLTLAEAVEAVAAAAGAEGGGSLPEAAVALLASLPPPAAAPDDALFALVVVLMAEVGFELETSQDESTTPLPVANDAGFDARRIRRLRSLPAGWQEASSGQRCVALRLPACPQHRVRLVGVSVGGALVSNALLCPGIEAGPSSFCLGLRAARFLEARRGVWRPRRLRELSRRVKDALATPARCAVLGAEGLRHPSLTGMPAEVLLRVANLLDARSLLALGRTNKSLRALSREPTLWRSLLLRDFGQPLNEEDAAEEAKDEAKGKEEEGEHPLDTYRRRYERERLWWRDREARDRWLRSMRHSGAEMDWEGESDTWLPPPRAPPRAPPRGPPMWYLPTAPSWFAPRSHHPRGSNPRPSYGQFWDAPDDASA